MNTTPDTDLRTKRSARGLTLGEIASLCGTDQGTVLRWERFDTEPSPSYRDAYSKALGISVEELGRIIYAGRRSKPSPVKVSPKRRARVAGGR